MSYDLRIWSVNPIDSLGFFCQKNNWKVENNSALYSKKDWQIMVGSSEKVESEDITDEIPALLAGIGYVTEINLEPIYASQTARAFLDKVAKDVAKEIVGVIENQQEGTLSLSFRNKKIHPSSSQKRRAFFRNQHEVVVQREQCGYERFA